MLARTGFAVALLVLMVGLSMAQDIQPAAPEPADPLAGILPEVPELKTAEDVTTQGRKVSEWIKLLDDSDAANRADAISALVQLQFVPEPVVPLLARLLVKDSDAEVRLQAALALPYTRRAGAPAAKALAFALDDKNEEVATESANSLGYLGVLGAEAAPQLATRVASDDATTQLTALALLVRMGVRAKPALGAARKALGSSSAGVRESAFCVITAMGAEGAEATPEVLTYLKAEVKSFIAAAKAPKDDPFESMGNNTRMDHLIMFACQLGPAMIEGFPAMLDALRAEPTQLVRWPAAVSNLGDKVAPLVMAAASIEEDYVAMQCIKATWGPLAKDCVKPLINILKSRPDSDRACEAALCALAFASTDAAEAEPVLLEYAAKDSWLANWAVQALGTSGIKSEETVKFLRGYCDVAAADVLLQFGLPALLNATGDHADILKRMPRESVNGSVVNLVEMLQGEALPLLVWLRERLKSSDSDWEKEHAIKAITALNEAGIEAAAELRPLLEKGPTSELFIPVMDALTNINDRESRSKIRKYIFDESLEVTANAIWSTTELGGDVGSALPKFVERLGDPESGYLTFPESSLPDFGFGSLYTPRGLWYALDALEALAEKAVIAKVVLAEFADAHYDMAIRARAKQVLDQLPE